MNKVWQARHTATVAGRTQLLASCCGNPLYYSDAPDGPGGLLLCRPPSPTSGAFGLHGSPQLPARPQGTLAYPRGGLEGLWAGTQQ